MKKYWYWIVAAVAAIAIGIKLWLKHQKRTYIINEWMKEEDAQRQEIRRLEKISKVQANEARKELEAIDKKYEQKKDALDEEIRNGQTTIADAWNRYFRAKRGTSVPTHERSTNK